MSLTVREIRVHGKPIAWLDPGTTAEIVLAGEGVEHLVPDMMLSGTPRVQP
ncbi:hypothetical protein ACQEU3_26705 [Spirillospora sp. CA-253888]